ncbi:MAG TPA: peroxiredoxin [Mycobacteriales bacterium]|jgi:peroxiredoxin|nr:peroxiredoxin [Mycobacteriales bacterium]
MPEVGDIAPAFTLRDQHGREQSLAARAEARNVLLVFYPFAFTGVCSGEMLALQEHVAEWDALATDVLAISCDPVPSLRAFADHAGLEIPLLSDFWPHGGVSASYGAFDATLGAAGRATYVIDKTGVVRWKVSSAIAEARDVSDYLKVLADL